MAIYTQTREQIKRDIALVHGGMLYYGTADSATASTIVHDELKRFTHDSALAGKEVDCVGGTNAGEALEISAFTASSGTITVVPNFATTPDTTTRYHVYDPSVVTKRILDTLITEAVMALGRQRFVATTSRKLILNDLISGEGDMETWTASTIPDNWTEGGTASTKTQQTSANDSRLVRYGSSSVKIVGSGSSVLYRAVTNPAQFDGATITVKGWVYAANASRVAVTLDINDGNYGSTHDSTAHSGNSTWEELSTAAIAISDMNALYPGVNRLTGSSITYYADHVRALLNRDVWEYTLPSGLVAISRIFVEGSTEDTFTHIEIPPHLYSIDRSASKLIIDRSRFSGYSDRRLLIQGLGSMTAPTSDSSTIEAPEAVKAYVNYELLARRRGVAVEQLEFAKRRRDEEFALAKRLPTSRNLKWIER